MGQKSLNTEENRNSNNTKRMTFLHVHVQHTQSLIKNGTQSSNFKIA